MRFLRYFLLPLIVLFAFFGYLLITIARLLAFLVAPPHDGLFRVDVPDDDESA